MSVEKRRSGLSKETFAAIWVGTAVIWGANAYNQHQEANQAEAKIAQFRTKPEPTTLEGLLLTTTLKLPSLPMKHKTREKTATFIIFLLLGMLL